MNAKISPTWKTHGHGDGDPRFKAYWVDLCIGFGSQCNKKCHSRFQSSDVFSDSSPFSSCYIFSSQSFQSQPSCLHSLSRSYWVNEDLRKDRGAWPLEERIGKRRKERKGWLMGFTTRRLSGVKRTAMNSPTTTFFCPAKQNAFHETHPGILNWGGVDSIKEVPEIQPQSIFFSQSLIVDCCVMPCTSTGSVTTSINFRIFPWRYCRECLL